MSFVTTQPEALDYAAGKLEGIGTSLAAQNASAAASTSKAVPRPCGWVATTVMHTPAQAIDAPTAMEERS